jgi:hypothetical protein
MRFQVNANAEMLNGCNAIVIMGKGEKRLLYVLQAFGYTRDNSVSYSETTEGGLCSWMIPN